MYLGSLDPKEYFWYLIPPSKCSYWKQKLTFKRKGLTSTPGQIVKKQYSHTFIPILNSCLIWSSCVCVCLYAVFRLLFSWVFKEWLLFRRIPIFTCKQVFVVVAIYCSLFLIFLFKQLDIQSGSRNKTMWLRRPVTNYKQRIGTNQSEQHSNTQLKIVHPNYLANKLQIKICSQKSGSVCKQKKVCIQWITYSPALLISKENLRVINELTILKAT